jgi:hypothetical protein
MAAAAPFIMAAGSIVQGVAGLSAGNANAKRLRMQRDEEGRATAGEIRRMKDEQRAVIGEQLAAQVSGGLEGGSGTALASLRQSQIEAALDVMELRRQGEFKMRALEQGAKDSKREGRFALLSGVLGAGSSFVKGSNDWALERRPGG